MKAEKNSVTFYIQCKAYSPLEEVSKNIENFLNHFSASKANFNFILPYPYLEPISKKLAKPEAAFCADSMLNISEGSFPASIAGEILKDAGATSVLLGSVDERKISKGKEQIKEKILKSLESGLSPIVCISETLGELREGRSKETIKKELSEALAEIPDDQLNGISVLYQAPWVNIATREEVSQTIPKAYQAFQETLAEVKPKAINKIAILYAVPVLIPEIFPEIKRFSPAGYYLGILDDSLTQSLEKILGN